jgi:hypothetical protein
MQLTHYVPIEMVVFVNMLFGTPWPTKPSLILLFKEKLKSIEDLRFFIKKL